MLQFLDDFVFEVPSVDAFSSFAGPGGVSSLDDESLDVPVEDGSVVVVFAAEGQEVLGGFGGEFAKEFELDVSVSGVQGHSHFKFNYINSLVMIVFYITYSPPGCPCARCRPS